MHHQGGARARCVTPMKDHLPYQTVHNKLQCRCAPVSWAHCGYLRWQVGRMPLFRVPVFDFTLGLSDSQLSLKLSSSQLCWGQESGSGMCQICCHPLSPGWPAISLPSPCPEMPPSHPPQPPNPHTQLATAPLTKLAQRQGLA